MPTIRKATRGSEFVHGYGTVTGGDEIDVDADTAEYLVESDGYERVESGESDAESDADTDTTEDTADDSASDDEVPVDDAIDQGVCPWCDEYEGESVGRHASSAHPDEWTAYKEDGD